MSWPFFTNFSLQASFLAAASEMRERTAEESKAMGF